MKKTKMQMLLAAVLSAAVLPLSYGQSAIEKEAKTLFDAGKYKACAEKLSKEVEKPGVSLDTLRLAMNANLRAGNPMSASLLATELLKRNPKDLDTLFEAAQIAELAGEEKLAVSRYHSYVVAAQKKKGISDVRLDKAISFVLSSGTDAEVFRAAVKRDGMEYCWWIATDMINTLSDRNELPTLCEHVFFITQNTDSPQVLDEMVRALDRKQNNFRDKRAAVRMLEVLSSVKWPRRGVDYGMLARYIAKLYEVADLSASERFNAGVRFIDNCGFIPNNSGAVLNEPARQYLRAGADGEAKSRAAKEIFAIVPVLLKTSEVWMMESIIGMVIDKDTKQYFDFVTPEQLGELYGRYCELKIAENPEWADTHFTKRIVDALYSGKRMDSIKFHRSMMKGASPAMMRQFFMDNREAASSGRKDSLIDEYLGAPEKANVAVHLKEAQMLDVLAASKSHKRFTDGLQYALLTTAYSTDRDVEDLSNAINSAGKGGLSAKDLVKALSSVVEKAGCSKSMEKLIDKLAGGEVFKSSSAALKALKSKKTGSEPLYTAAAKVWDTDASNMAAHNAAVDAFLKAYKGDVPTSWNQVNKTSERAAFNVYHYNKKQSWSNADQTKALIKRWIPRMAQPGREQEVLLSKAWQLDGANRQGGLYYECMKSVLPNKKKYKEKSVWMDWNGWNSVTFQPKSDTTLFSAGYGVGTDDYTVAYIDRSKEVWSKDYFFKQLESYLNDPDTTLDGWAYNWLWNMLVHGDFKYKGQIPVSTVQAWVKKAFAESQKNKKVDLGCELDIIRVLEKQEEKEAVLAMYAGLIKSRPAKQQLAAVNSVAYKYGSFAFCETALTPLLKDVKNWRYYSVGNDLLRNLHNIVSSKDSTAELKSRANALLKPLRNAILSGNAVIAGDMPQGAEYTADGLAEYVKNNSPTAINRAAVVMGYALAREGNEWRGRNTANKTKEALKATTPQIQYVFLNTFTVGSSQFNTKMKSEFALEISRLAKDIPGLVPVDKSDKAYDLFLAQQVKQEGNALQAWSLVSDKIPLLCQRWKEFNFDFVLWVVDQARKFTLYKEALELAQTMWMDENKLPAGDAAKLGLYKGDVYRDQKNYPAAKIEYESLTNTKRYSVTEAGRAAKFRLVELLILTQDYSSARTQLERLQESVSLQDQAEAYYLLARVDYDNQDYESATENLNQVFIRMYSHEQARLLQGEIMLKTDKLSSPILEMGQRRLASIAIPGKPVTLLIQDMNLAVIRGGAALPVQVTTTNGKDREVVELMPDPQDPTKFSQVLPTALGKAVPNDLVLQLNGNDEIIYEIEPKFQKDNGIDLEPKRLELRAPAKLFASSQPILSEEEQEQLRIMDDLLLSSGRAVRNTSKVVRPGSPFYVRVIDHDMSKNPHQPDSLFVDIFCSSGDELRRYELKETGNSTGVFEAKVPTGIPFPNVLVSDAVEGEDTNAVINSTKKGSWKSLADGKRPKWLEVDSMSSYNFKEASIKMPNPRTIKRLRVLGSLDGAEEELAVFPAEDKGKHRSGLRMVTGNRHSTGADALNHFFQSITDNGVSLTSPSCHPRDLVQSYRGKNNNMSYMITGAFYLPQNEEIVFKFMQPADNSQYAFLYIDDQLLIGGAMNTTGLAIRRAKFLSKGIHTIKVLGCDRNSKAAIRVGRLMPDGSFEALPGSWFDAEKNPELADYLKPKGKITQNADGYSLTLDKSLRYRTLKWVFEDFTGTQVEVTRATAKDDKGADIVPVTQDLTSGKGNNILEIAAADRITVKYEDVRRIDDNKGMLSSELSSSFRDAQAGFFYEEVRMDEEGKTFTALAEAARAGEGDDIVIQVIDPDMDRSEDMETVKVQLMTSSGEKMELELLENANPGGRGQFRESFRAGNKTDAKRRMLKVSPGDTIKMRYYDEENNRPGIPVYREAVLVNNAGTTSMLTVMNVKVLKVEDKSPAAQARIQMMRNKGDKRENIVLYKDLYEISRPKEETARKPKPGEAAEPQIINGKAPLLLELECPALAKHRNSRAYVEVMTKTELDAAEAERREPIPLRVELKLSDVRGISSSKGYQAVMAKNEARYGQDVLMDRGIFAGIVRLQLGSANDEINDLVASSETFNLLSQDNYNLDGDAFKVPTVIVSGSDLITLSFKDDTGREIAKKELQLRSDGELELLDRAYLTQNADVHLGQNFYVKVYDPDRDITAERDTVEVWAVSKLGDKVKMQLAETLPHSGIFTGSLKVDLKRSADAVKTDSNVLWSNFGDAVTFTYTDEIPLASRNTERHVQNGKVLIGSDGELAIFTKKFKDPDMAVKTNFLMAEALFEMAKSHKEIKGEDGKTDPEKKEQARQEIAKGKRVLEEALRDYPNTTLKAQGEFLLANLSEQLENYQEALTQFSAVISKYPDSEYAPKSYFQKAICYERLSEKADTPERKLQLGDMACEEFVRLSYLYPNSDLAADAKVRLGNYYYKTQRYRLAANVLEKFSQAHASHTLAARALLLAGFSYRKNEELKVEQAEKLKRQYKPDYTAAIRVFTELAEKYKDNKNERAQALYFAGDSYYALGTHEGKVKAYQKFQQLIWDYPETKWAKVARGRMAANPIKNTR